MGLFSLSNKTILITGASSGIGRSCAVQCSKMGASLLLMGRNVDELNRTVSELQPGTKVEMIVADFSKMVDLELLIAEKILTIGKIAGFIHCAGVEKTLPLKKQTSEVFQSIFDINVFAGFELAKIISLKKYKAEKASFVFIASVAGMVGESGKTIYSASKGAVISGARSMSMELARSDIRVNSISPAMVKTPILEKMFDGIGEEASQNIIKKHPLGIGEPEDVANACVFLLSDAAKWITGTNLVVDGGYTAQ
ncbi:NAD(P)-dependent dehydrogenase, short-chain alcohol dehydrogenase family [Kaistella chaponensis]|uniref:NAD(P)-dependent dehydrogenase, short-chain alcohol dehydrogenase family n=1 Tax=Kaistella chaponensis TaxID=713588 RepID=A0A1N7MCI6_9FLAO|nr:SDR family oxidoreductase [Kaistella chaponensis]SIS83836.1 NAD(P)-dependent dehydrogenase, short-chain alcohol dehydrogenase family [Kaistella chaponensis]